MDRVMQEFLKATARVDLDHQGFASWLAWFAQCDLDRLSEGDRANLGCELAVFLIGPARGPGFAAHHVPSFPDDLVRELQRIALNHLQDLADDRETMFPQITLEAFISRAGVDQITHGEMFKGVPQNFHYACYRLLSEHGARLRRCLRCRTLFFAVRRSDQDYCSAGCQNLAAVKRYRSSKTRGKRGRARKRKAKGLRKGGPGHGGNRKR